MTAAELIRRLRRLGRRAGVEVVFVAERGKGSHGTLYYGNRHAVVKDRTKEIGKGLLAAILDQLGIDRDDFQRG